MAQLSHPNVVTVFDVGTYEDQIFIVMELVEGQTLAHWLSDRRPGWPEIVRAFVDAGRGLAAAHAVQIVHRDFKPANVLVGRDGRVRVTDFGLARPFEIASSASLTGKEASEAPVADAISGVTLASLTATEGGGLAGTPIFMAPEQFLRRRTVARSDQFSFCVALYIALYGHHPFFGDDRGPRTVGALASAVTEGHLRPPPSGSSVPPRVFDALARGLQTDPEKRFPSMEGLLDALTRESSTEARPPRRPLLLAASLAFVVIAVVLIGVRLVPRHSPAEAAGVAASQPVSVTPEPLSSAPPSPPTELARTDREATAKTPTVPTTRAAPRTDRKAHAPTPKQDRERYDNGLKEPF
jgi:serine/threonine protein kinase